MLNENNNQTVPYEGKGCSQPGDLTFKGPPNLLFIEHVVNIRHNFMFVHWGENANLDSSVTNGFKLVVD